MARPRSGSDRLGDAQQSVADDRDRQSSAMRGTVCCGTARPAVLGSGQQNPTLTVNNGHRLAFAGSSTNNFGWTAGVGVEWAFAGGWSARAEYDYIGLQNQSLTVGATGGPFAGDIININNRNINMFTAGVNYKFGGGWW